MTVPTKLETTANRYAHEQADASAVEDLRPHVLCAFVGAEPVPRLRMQERCLHTVDADEVGRRVLREQRRRTRT